MFSYKLNNDFRDLSVVALTCGPSLNAVFFFLSGRLETNDMCGTKNSLHLALEVEFPGCYAMMTADHNLLIRTPTTMDKKLIFSRRIYTAIDSRTSDRREKMFFLMDI